MSGNLVALRDKSCHVDCLFIVNFMFGAFTVTQGGHKPGKPGILRAFSEHGKLGEFCATSAKNCNKQSILSLSFKYLCKTAVDWVVTCYVAGVDVE